MHNLEAAQLDALVAELGDMAADRDTSRWIMDSIRVILGGSRNTPKITEAIDAIDDYTGTPGAAQTTHNE